MNKKIIKLFTLYKNKQKQFRTTSESHRPRPINAVPMSSSWNAPKQTYMYSLNIASAIALSLLAPNSPSSMLNLI